MSEKQRLLKVLCGLLALVVLGTCYLWFYLKFGVGIPCVINRITGLKCPGCGMTRAVAALWQGNLDKAVAMNALAVSVVPVLCLYLLYRAVRFVRGDEKSFYIWEYVLLVVLFVVTAVYGVARNVL